PSSGVDSRRDGEGDASASDAVGSDRRSSARGPRSRDPYLRMQEKNWWRLPALAIAFGIVGLALAIYLLLQGVEPFATWFYNFAWYPVLIAGDGVVALVGGAGRG